MKKLIAFLLLLILAATLLCGCGKSRNHDWDRLMRIDSYTDVGIYADKETGVEYFVYSSGYGDSIAPVLNADGTPVLAPNFDAREDRTGVNP